MRKMKWISALIVAIFLANSAAVAADIPDEQFVTLKPPTDDRYTGINFAFNETEKNTMSSLQGFTTDGVDALSRSTCSKLGDPGCEAGKYLQYNSQLTLCNTIQITDCVKSVTAKDSSGKIHVGKFVEDYPGKTKYTYEGNPSVNLPPGSSSFIVDFPEIAHKGGTQYLVIVSILGNRGLSETIFTMEDFTTAIYAVSKIQGDNFILTEPSTAVGKGVNLGGRPKTGPGGTACVQTDGKSCLIAWGLDVNTEFSLSLKLSTKISGWLHGRFSEAKSEIATASDGDQIVTLSGKPVVVPGLFGWFEKGKLPSSLIKEYGEDKFVDVQGAGWQSNSGQSYGPDGRPYSILKTAFGYDEGGLKEMLAWIDALSDKSAYAPTVWSAKSIRSGSQFERCMKGQSTLSGIVATNATIYIGAPPKFNDTEQTLDYKVAAPHYLPNGSEFKGTYNLVIRSEVARCIYGFTDAPVSATISIVSSDGTNQVATTLFSEKDGWIYLSANNFTFSSPILKVKLKQEVSKPLATPTKSATTSPAAAAKKTTITCVKGKTTKKVSAKNPKCPMGFKKK